MAATHADVANRTLPRDGRSQLKGLNMTVAAQPRSASLSHFLKIAKRGSRPGASGGERRAAKLLEATLEAFGSIDDVAVSGFGEFCLMLATDPGEARELAE